MYDGVTSRAEGPILPIMQARLEINRMPTSFTIVGFKAHLRYFSATFFMRALEQEA